MQKSSGLCRVGSGRASGRNQRSFSFASSVNYDGKIAGLYDLEETLGRGHFAVVKLARHVFTGEKVAVKVIDKTKLDEVSRAHLFQEVRCMKLVQHPNVVRLYEVIDTQTKLYLILELGDGGDLYDYIMRHENGLDQESARHYFQQVVHAISYCHQLHVVHRDLKPENVVFFEKLGMVKLTDFGFSNKYNPGQKLETSCGSLAYSAPEILLGDSYDAPAVDIWSLGVILYMLVCGHPPFQEANDSETLTMIMDCKYTVPPHVSEGCRRLIGRMLQRDPVNRATLEDIANDPWLQTGSTIQPAAYLPLVSREHLSEEDHAVILQKMVNGNIATKEEILDALDKNEYNNITATYFLLAERKLRAQRHEQALMLSRGHLPDTLPNPINQDAAISEAAIAKDRWSSPEEQPPVERDGSNVTLKAIKPLEPAPRIRKYSVVDEEDETIGSGSESSRRSQRSSSNSLGSQRTSNTSLASQRTSNNSLASALRARGLFNAASTVAAAGVSTQRTALGAARSPDLRLELILQQEEKSTKVSASSVNRLDTQKSVEQPLEVPAPFPTTSNIGLGLRSPRASPLTSPVSGHRMPVTITGTGSGWATPVSPNSPSTPLSPLGSPAGVLSPQGGSTTKNRSSLPSSSRVLHAVRSSPQLVLNEIFEEAESCSDGEANPVILGIDKASSGTKHRSSAKGHGPPAVSRRIQSRAVSVGPMIGTYASSCSASSGSSSTSPPNLVRRYEQRRQLNKLRTASCSSSDASDDDNECRKKWIDQLKSASHKDPREDSNDDNQGSGGSTSGSGGVSSGATGSAQLSARSSNSKDRSGRRQESNSSRSSSSSTSSTHSRAHLEPIADQDHTRTRFSSIIGNATGHRYVKNNSNNSAYGLLSPGISNETHLRASQSLSCLTEVCENGDASSAISLDIPVTAKWIPTRSCTDLEKIEEVGTGDVMEAQESRNKLMVLTTAHSSQPSERSGPRLNESVPLSFSIAVPTANSCADSKESVVAQPGKKQKRLKQIFSRREATHSTLKTEKQQASRRLRVRSSNNLVKAEVVIESPNGAEAVTCALPEADVAGHNLDGKSGKSMSFLRSRLYKAKSLGSLVKERILVEASHCQYELWKRFGRKNDQQASQNSPDSQPGSRPNSKRYMQSKKHGMPGDFSMTKNSDSPSLEPSLSKRS